MSKITGLEPRYSVTKLSNPEKKIDCIVLEFDDPIAQVGIYCWAEAMRQKGYDQVYQDVLRKLRQYDTKKPPKVPVSRFDPEEEEEELVCIECDGKGEHNGDFQWICTRCWGKGYVGRII